jgi:hypothetical protein
MSTIAYFSSTSIKPAAASHDASIDVGKAAWVQHLCALRDVPPDWL